jgi:protein-arginine kinase activator protein McsA
MGELNFNSLMKSPPRCPLCGTPMTVEMDTIRNIKVFACHKDQIAINVMDPLVGKWEEEREEKVPCPMCDTNMRLFFTSTGFLMSKCPKKKCGAVVKGSNPDRFSMGKGALGLDGVKVDPKNTDKPEDK